MNERSEKALSRRAALRRMLGGDLRDRMQVTGMVEDYRTLLREVAHELPFGVTRDRLPASAPAVADAIVEVVTKSLMDLPRGTLREAYASLALFRDAAEVEVLQSGKADFDRQDFSPEAQERIRIAFEKRNRLLADRVRMEREFDQRVPPPAPPAKETTDEESA